MRLPLSIAIERRHPLARMLSRGRIARLVLHADGRMTIVRQDGTEAEAAVEAGTTVLPGLIVLWLRANGRTESLVLPVAAMGSEAHRRLRVWLKWRASVAA